MSVIVRSGHGADAELVVGLRSKAGGDAGGVLRRTAAALAAGRVAPRAGAVNTLLHLVGCGVPHVVPTEVHRGLTGIRCAQVVRSGEWGGRWRGAGRPWRALAPVAEGHIGQRSPCAGTHPEMPGHVARQVLNRVGGIWGDDQPRRVGVRERGVGAELAPVDEHALNRGPRPGYGSGGSRRHPKVLRRGGPGGLGLGLRLRCRCRGWCRGWCRRRGSRSRNLFVPAGRNHEAGAEQQREQRGPPADGCELASERLHATYLPVRCVRTKLNKAQADIDMPPAYHTLGPFFYRNPGARGAPVRA